MNVGVTAPRYSMHKYWGKKPASGIEHLIDKYTNPGDVIIDPFSGYGVFCCEAYIKNRNVIVNDLNPAANFIERNLFSQEVNISSVINIWNKIKSEFSLYVDDWYRVEIGGDDYYPVSVLRNKNGVPIKFTFKSGRKTFVKDIPEDVAIAFCEYENNYDIKDWYPDVSVIENSRISARSGMKVQDFFTKRALACHAKLFSLIEKYADGADKDLLLMAFTANLANCSKLVPPIKSRGILAQGAWMTGFYVGETYIENNVLHYYENRVKKVINGKRDFLSKITGDLFDNSSKATYKITNFDAKKLHIPDSSVDYVFADPPYGDSVPYFEQSVIWNAWLRLAPDYQQEIVISDSHQREKGVREFENDINMAFSEIKRVLKEGKYFSLTFHSLSGLEWRSVSNACVFNNFDIVGYEWLEQKTYPPRQLNRIKSVKGDVLVTFRKNSMTSRICTFDDGHFTENVIKFIDNTIQKGISDTNGIMMEIMKWILENKIVVGGVDVFEVLNKNFLFKDSGQWMKI